jgi:hypothetical protein
MLWFNDFMKHILIMGLLICAPHAAIAQDAAEVAFVKSVLDPLQAISFKKKREYCGYIARLDTGELFATPPTRGRRSSCLADEPNEDLNLIASYHTHAAFTWRHDSEVPSTSDVEADMNEGLNGYVSTPGGRVWFINGETGVSKQVCGLSCTRPDKRFEAEVYGPVEQTYTLKELTKRLEDG